MKVGTVVQTEENGLLVITETDGNKVIKFESLEEYISTIAVINFKGEYVTIREALDICCSEYIKNHDFLALSPADKGEE